LGLSGRSQGLFTDGLVERVTGFYGVRPSVEFVQVVTLVENTCDGPNSAARPPAGALRNMLYDPETAIRNLAKLVRDTNLDLKLPF
jgi:hypothetical protein